MTHDIEENKRLCEKYPFLIPRYVWDGEIVDEYDYSYTEWDSIPSGWRIAFGDMFLEELGKAVYKAGLQNDFRLIDIKEKWGRLTIYTSNTTDEIEEIIEKYSELSEHICMVCGKPDVYVTTAGWIWPSCQKCWEDNEWNMQPYEKVINKEAANNMADKRVYQHYDSKTGQWIKREVDISATANKIRERWKANHAEI